MPYNDMRHIIKKYSARITGWRSGLSIHSWPEIAAMIAADAGIPAPSASGLRRAWQRPARPARPDQAETLAVAQSSHQEKPVFLPETRPERPARPTRPDEAPAPAVAQSTQSAEQEHAKLLAFREAARREKNLKTFASAFD